MPTSPCYLFKNSYEFLPKSEIEAVPMRVRGIYALFKESRSKKLDVVYIGMARGEKSGVLGRLRCHVQDDGKDWTHFSVYEVWDNITREQVEELEGLFRHIYRHDGLANRFNIQKTYAPLQMIERSDKNDWKTTR